MVAQSDEYTLYCHIKTKDWKIISFCHCSFAHYILWISWPFQCFVCHISRGRSTHQNIGLCLVAGPQKPLPWTRPRNSNFAPWSILKPKKDTSCSSLNRISCYPIPDHSHKQYTVQSPVSNQRKCQAKVVAYGRWSLMRVRPELVKIFPH